MTSPFEKLTGPGKPLKKDAIEDQVIIATKLTEE